MLFISNYWMTWCSFYEPSVDQYLTFFFFFISQAVHCWMQFKLPNIITHSEFEPKLYWIVEVTRHDAHSESERVPKSEGWSLSLTTPVHTARKITNQQWNHFRTPEASQWCNCLVMCLLQQHSTRFSLHTRRLNNCLFFKFLLIFQWSLKRVNENFLGDWMETQTSTAIKIDKVKRIYGSLLAIPPK